MKIALRGRGVFDRAHSSAYLDDRVVLAQQKFVDELHDPAAGGEPG